MSKEQFEALYEEFEAINARLGDAIYEVEQAKCKCMEARQDLLKWQTKFLCANVELLKSEV